MQLEAEMGERLSRPLGTLVPSEPQPELVPCPPVLATPVGQGKPFGSLIDIFDQALLDRFLSEDVAGFLLDDPKGIASAMFGGSALVWRVGYS